MNYLKLDELHKSAGLAGRIGLGSDPRLTIGQTSQGIQHFSAKLK